MKKVKLIYTGSRFSGRKKYFRYVGLLNPQEVYTFTRKIAKFESIGSIIESEVEGSTFSQSKLTGRIDEHYISHWPNVPRWELEERDGIEKKESIDTARKFESPLKASIESIRNNMFNMNRTQKLRIAKYVFDQLIR